MHCPFSNKFQLLSFQKMKHQPRAQPPFPLYCLCKQMTDLYTTHFKLVYPTSLVLRNYYRAFTPQNNTQLDCGPSKCVATGPLGGGSDWADREDTRQLSEPESRRTSETTGQMEGPGGVEWRARAALEAIGRWPGEKVSFQCMLLSYHTFKYMHTHNTRVHTETHDLIYERNVKTVSKCFNRVSTVCHTSRNPTSFT